MQGGYLPPTYLWDSYFGVVTTNSGSVNQRDHRYTNMPKKTEMEKFVERKEFSSLKQLARTNPNIVTMVKDNAKQNYPALYKEIVSQPDLFAMIWK